MDRPPGDVARRLLYILYRGLVQARNLALAQGNEQIADLADTLELLPGYLDHWDDQHLEMIHYILRTYQEKYPGSTFDYLATLDQYPPPDRW